MDLAEWWLEEEEEMPESRTTYFSELAGHVTCGLCRGILVDVSTVVECLHSFCRSCLVQWLQTNNHCPKCSNPLDTVCPLKDVKPDPKLQELISALFPEVHKDETSRRREFYHALGMAAIEDKVYVRSASAVHHHQQQPYDSLARIPLLESRDNRVWVRLDCHSELKCIKLVKEESQSVPAFVRCPAFTTVHQLSVRIESHLEGLHGTRNIVRFYHGDIEMSGSLTLLDVFTSYHKSRSFPVVLNFLIFPEPEIEINTDFDSTDAEIKVEEI